MSPMSSARPETSFIARMYSALALYTRRRLPMNTGSDPAGRRGAKPLGAVV